MICILKAIFYRGVVSFFFLFSPRKLGKVCQFDLHIFFQMGCFNHQPESRWMVTGPSFRRCQSCDSLTSTISSTFDTLPWYWLNGLLRLLVHFFVSFFGPSWKPPFPNMPYGVFPLKSMGLVYSPTFMLIFMINVGKYTSPMDPMGLKESWLLIGPFEGLSLGLGSLWSACSAHETSMAEVVVIVVNQRCAVLPSLIINIVNQHSITTALCSRLYQLVSTCFIPNIFLSIFLLTSYQSNHPNRFSKSSIPACCSTDYGNSAFLRLRGSGTPQPWTGGTAMMGDRKSHISPLVFCLFFTGEWWNTD